MDNRWKYLQESFSHFHSLFFFSTLLLLQESELFCPAISTAKQKKNRAPVSRNNFSGLKATLEIETSWTVEQFLTHKPVNSALLTNSFIAILSFAKLLPVATANHKIAFRTRKVTTGTFEKRAPGGNLVPGDAGESRVKWIAVIVKGGIKHGFLRMDL